MGNLRWLVYRTMDGETLKKKDSKYTMMILLSSKEEESRKAHLEKSMGSLGVMSMDFAG